MSQDIIPDSDWAKWAAEVKTWLANDCKCHTITQVKVTIGKHIYYGCRYIDPKHVDPAPRIYLVGHRPKHRRKTCYMINGGNDEWYVAGYCDMENIRSQPTKDSDQTWNKFHPFGSSFILMPWTFDGSIDLSSRTPYDHMAITVEELIDVRQNQG